MVCCAGPGWAATRGNRMEGMEAWDIDKPGLYPGPAMGFVAFG